MCEEAQNTGDFQGVQIGSREVSENRNLKMIEKEIRLNLNFIGLNDLEQN